MATRDWQRDGASTRASRVWVSLALWALSCPGLLKADAVLIRLGEEMWISAVLEAASGEILVASRDRGLFATYEGHGLTLLPAEDGVEGRAIYCLAQTPEGVLIGAQDGVYLLGEATYARMPLSLRGRPVVNVASILYDAEHDELWLGAEEGLLRGSAKSDSVDLLLPGSINLLTRIGDRVIVATDNNAYTFNRGLQTFLPVSATVELKNIRQAIELDGRLFLHAPAKQDTTYHHEGLLHVVRDDRPEEPIPGVLSLGDIDGALWIAVQSQFFRYGRGLRNLDLPFRGGGEMSSKESPFEKGGPITMIQALGGFAWLASTEHLVRQERRGEPLLPVMSIEDLHLIDGIETNLGVLFWGAKGVFRTYEEVELQVRLNTISFFGQQFVWGAARVLGVQYRDRHGNDPFGESVSRKFDAILETEPAFFDRRKRARAYLPLDEERNRPSTPAELLVSVRDAYGNVKDPALSGRIRVIPKWFGWLVFVLIASPLLYLVWRILPTRVQFYLFFSIFRLGEVWPIFRVFAPSPSWPVLRGVFHRRNRRVLRQRGGRLDEKVVTALDFELGGRRLEVVTPTTPRLPEALEAHVASIRRGALSEMTPIAVSLGDVDSLTVEQLEEIVISRLQSVEPFGSAAFYKELLRRNSIVFFFLMERRSEDVLRAIKKLEILLGSKDLFRMIIETARANVATPSRPGGQRQLFVGKTANQGVKTPAGNDHSEDQEPHLPGPPKCR